MCRWLTYVGERTFLHSLLYHPEHSLVRQSLHSQRGTVTTNGDGFGIGWYGEREVPGTYHEVLPAWNDKNLRSLSHQLSATLFCAHVRARPPARRRRGPTAIPSRTGNGCTCITARSAAITGSAGRSNR